MSMTGLFFTSLIGVGSALVFKDAVVLTSADVGPGASMTVPLNSAQYYVYATYDVRAANASEYANRVTIGHGHQFTNLLMLGYIGNSSDMRLGYIIYDGPVTITDKNSLTTGKKVPYVVYIVSSAAKRYPIYAAAEGVFNREKFAIGAVTILNTFPTVTLNQFDGTSKNLRVFTCGFDSIADSSYKILDIPIPSNSTAKISSPIFTVVDEMISTSTSLQFSIEKSDLSINFVTVPRANVVISSPGWASPSSTFNVDHTYTDVIDGGFHYDKGTHSFADVQVLVGELFSTQKISLAFTDGTAVKSYDLKSKDNIADKGIAVNSFKFNVVGVASSKPDYLIKILPGNGFSHFELFASFLAVVAMLFRL